MKPGVSNSPNTNAYHTSSDIKLTLLLRCTSAIICHLTCKWFTRNPNKKCWWSNSWEPDGCERSLQKESEKVGRLFRGRECCEWRPRRPAETQTVRPAGNVTCTGPWTPRVRNRSLSMKALRLLRGFTIVETLQTPSSTIARETVEAHHSRHIEICQGCVLSWKVGWYFH